MIKTHAIRFLAMILALAAPSHAADDLASGFANPPSSARPHTWWHWMNGNITAEGITADLEAMQRVGVGGAQIFAVEWGIPPGNVDFMTDAYRELVKHAAREADRLGLELCVHNCAGWSSSGGPWITPEHAMQFVETSEARARGPAKFTEHLPQPPTRLGYYRDIAVLAFPTPPDEIITWKEYQPHVTTSAPQQEAAKLVDGDPTTFVTLPPPTASRPQYVNLELNRPLTARSLVVTPAPGGKAFRGNVEVSEDGKGFHDAGAFELSSLPHSPQIVPLAGDGAIGRYFRLKITGSDGRSKVLLAEVELTPRAMIGDLQIKAGYQPSPVGAQDTHGPAGEQPVPHGQILDLTDKLAADGALNWDVPKGEWTIVRIGHTPTGRENRHPAKGGEGLECDKFGREALDAHWAGMMHRLIDDLGPLAGKTLNNVLIDSYEVGGQNWTPRMREEFRRRRGYDPLPFLPVMTGRIVDSREVSERFLWDLRRTIADLMAENYYGHFAELCHQHGMQSSIEPYEGPFESLQVGQTADIPMGEFDIGNPPDKSIKLASSIGHVYGRRIVGAESFTAGPEQSRWLNYPYELKALGDLVFAQGVNRYVFHRYAHQPWISRYPGMTLGPYGIQFERTNTWFEQSRAWLTYITRCQYLLQQGSFVADVAYFCGEEAPSELKAGTPATPAGFDWDAVNADVLLHHASVKNGRIVLDSGMSYAALVLAPDETLIRPALLRKIKELVLAGATVTGPKPQRSPSLEDYPECDHAVKALADELWDSGLVKPEQSLHATLYGKGLKPDFEITGPDPKSQLVYIHRSLADGEVYFVSNQRDAYDRADCVFRVDGKRPELWHPDSGLIEDAPMYAEKDGRTTVHLQLDPRGSVFVVFRKPADSVPHLTAVASDGEPSKANEPSPAYELTITPDGLTELLVWRPGAYSFVGSDGKQVRADVSRILEPVEVRGPWELAFPPNWGAPPAVKMDTLIPWTDHPDPGVKYFSGTATYTKDIEIPGNLLGSSRHLYLDLGTVKYLAEVKVNGQEMGILWKPPFRVKLDGVARPGSNHLEIRVTNLWPNRLIGDEQLPPDVQWRGARLAGWPEFVLEGKPSPHGRLTFATWRHWTRDMQPVVSGLLGPVMLKSAERIAISTR